MSRSALPLERGLSPTRRRVGQVGHQVAGGPADVALYRSVSRRSTGPLAEVRPPEQPAGRVEEVVNVVMPGGFAELDGLILERCRVGDGGC